jgi:hypothetical protein
MYLSYSQEKAPSVYHTRGYIWRGMQESNLRTCVQSAICLPLHQSPITGAHGEIRTPTPIGRDF